MARYYTISAIKYKIDAVTHQLKRKKVQDKVWASSQSEAVKEYYLHHKLVIVYKVRASRYSKRRGKYV